MPKGGDCGAAFGPSNLNSENFWKDKFRYLKSISLSAKAPSSPLARRLFFM